MIFLPPIVKKGYFFLFAILFCLYGLSGVCQTHKYLKSTEELTSDAYLPGIIIVKLKDHQNVRRQGTSVSLQEMAVGVGAHNFDRVFPHHSSVTSQARITKKEYATRFDTDLSRIYKLNVDPDRNITEVIKELLQHEEVAYAEPYYLMKPLQYVPNDPEANTTSGAQKYLTTIKAYDAWEIEQGDTSIVIGILDTGVGLGHEDLDNLQYNHDDPINGTDDDGDGYVDNYLGWDMANDDNDPNADKDTHGTAVTGLAAATTDNEIGMSGTGFRSRYLPVKIFTSEDNTFNHGYEAIVYAADQGCKVINLSWGSEGVYSQFAQDIINYAVLEKDVVVVAAAGNSGKFEYYYPASYENVLSVTNSDITDKKNTDATYNYLVDLIAPGTDIFTTKNDDLYMTGSGTSFAAPLVAGAAALVRAKYPDLTATQVMERIRLGADDIYKVGSNSNFPEQLGYGRLNMLKALQEWDAPALRLLQFEYNNGIGKYAMKGDTLSISIDISNYLTQSSASASVTLSSPSPYVTLLDSVLQVQMLDTFAVLSNQDQPFRVVLHEDLPLGEELLFRLGLADEMYNYQDYQYFWFDASSDYLDLDIGETQLTLGSNGSIGFNPELSNEVGFAYKANQLASELGLIMAGGKDSVSDNSIISFSEGNRSTDFTKLTNLHLEKDEAADIEAASVFSDSLAAHPMNLRIEQTVLGNTNDNYFVVQYRVINTGDSTLHNLHTALFSDWELNDPENNKAAWDETHQLGYTYATSGNDLFAGIALLTAQAPVYYAIDKDSLNGNTTDLMGDLTDSVKYEFLKNGIAKTEAGTMSTGNDVAQLLGATIDSLSKNAAVQVAFAIIGGESLQALQQAVTDAKAAYNAYLQHPDLLGSVEICTDSTAAIAPQEGENFKFYQDPLGTTLLQEGSDFTTGTISTDSAVYVTNLDAGYESAIGRFVINIVEPEAKFAIDESANAGYINDTLFLDESGNFALPLQDESTHAVQWEWDFDNGYASTLQHPKPRYTEKGNYTITLTAVSAPGCKNTSTKNITVVRRSPKPAISNANLCEGETVTLAASNATQLQLYAGKTLEMLIAKGSTFEMGPFATDTVFYIVNTDSVYHSLPTTVEITVDQAGFDFSVAIDTLQLDEKYLLHLEGTGNLPDNRNYTWFANEDSIGEGTKTVYNYVSQLDAEVSNFDISLRAKTEQGCAYTVSRTFKIAASPLPEVNIEKPCLGDHVQIHPSGGKIFYFYADADLEELLYKGSSFTLEDLPSDTVIYITNIDSLQESPSLTVPVILDNFADFTASADTIRLNTTDTVRFSAFTTDPNESRDISWLWDFGNGNTAEVPIVTQLYDTTGVYSIQLTAQAAGGCTNIIKKELVVENIVSVQDEEFIEKATRLYPNPTANVFEIENQYWRYTNLQVTLATLQGQILWSHEIYYRISPIMLDIEQEFGRKLPLGTYLISITTENHKITKKLIINP